MRPSLRATAPAIALALLASSAAAQRPGVSSPFQATPYMGVVLTTNLVDGPLGTTLSNATGSLYGGQLALRLAPSISLVGNVGYSSSDIRVGVPFLGGYDVGTSTMLLYDGSIQLELPRAATSGLGVTPFVQGGVGGMRFEASAAMLETQATNLAFNIGGGADISLGRSVGVRFMAKDYIGKLDFREAIGLDVGEGKTTHNVALTVGLRVDF